VLFPSAWPAPNEAETRHTFVTDLAESDVGYEEQAKRPRWPPNHKRLKTPVANPRQPKARLTRPNDSLVRRTLKRVVYDSRTRQVVVELGDGTQFEFPLALPNRRGARSAFRLREGRVPRVSRLMALAIKFERLVREQRFRDYAEIARLGKVSRARLSHRKPVEPRASPFKKPFCFCLRPWLATTALPKDARPHRGTAQLGAWYVAPTYRQGKRIAWALLKELTRPLCASPPNETDLRIELITGATIAIRGADHYDSLRGEGLDFLVLDEFASMDPEAWSEVLRPAVGPVGGSPLHRNPKGTPPLLRTVPSRPRTTGLGHLPIHD